MPDRIDDVYEATKSQYPEPDRNIPGELALDIAGQLVPVIGIVNAIREQYSRQALERRFRAMTDAVNSKVDAVSARVDSPAVAEAVRVAIEETWRTTDINKVKRFGVILGGSIAEGTQDKLEQAADIIRTVAQLHDRDIRALESLYLPNADIMRQYSNLHDPNPFVERWPNVVRQAASSAGLAGDEFFSTCKRLEGFGLAIELPRNPSRMQPGEYSFRPTRRGERLLSLLGYDAAPR